MPAPASATYGHWSCMDRSVSLPAQSANPTAPDHTADLQRGAGAPLVEDAAAPLGGDGEAARRSTAGTGAAWLARGAQRDLGVDARRRRTPGRTPASRRTAPAMSTVKARSRKTDSLMSGMAGAQFVAAEDDQNREAAHDAGPRRASCPSPRPTPVGSRARSVPMPTATSTAPGRRAVRGVAGSEMWASAVRISATTATGTLTQKIARQVQVVSQPPSIGPTAVRPPVRPKNRARARPRRSIGNTATTTASAAGNSSAAPRPWVARKTIEPGLGVVPVGYAAAQRGGDDEDQGADHARSDGGPTESASRPPSGEERGQGQQIGVDHPLHAGGGKAEFGDDVRRRDRHDRLVDERHRDGEHHRGQRQRLGGRASGTGGTLVTLRVRTAHLVSLRPNRCRRTRSASRHHPCGVRDGTTRTRTEFRTDGSRPPPPEIRAAPLVGSLGRGPNTAAP